MPNEERKWRSYKKACKDKFIPFTSHIIPVFTGTTATDSYGVWTAGNSGIKYGAGWKVFDKDTSSLAGISNNFDTTTRGYVILHLPEGVLISAEEFVVKCKGYGVVFKIYVEGSTDGQNWTSITEEASTSTSTKDITLVTTSQEYFSKFRLAIYKYDNSGNTYRDGDLYDWKFTKGTLKVLYKESGGEVNA